MDRHAAGAIDKQAGDVATLDRLNQQYVTSVESSDVSWFDANLAPDFMNSNPDGSLVDRAQFLAQIARPATISNLEANDVRVRVMGDFAIIHARTTYMHEGGRAGAGRYTDIWARREGRWLCVAAQVTRSGGAGGGERT
jgi:ketosteroid isomerase-like protein